MQALQWTEQVKKSSSTKQVINDQKIHACERHAGKRKNGGKMVTATLKH